MELTNKVHDLLNLECIRHSDSKLAEYHFLHALFFPAPSAA